MKTIVITGASDGLGKALVERLVRAYIVIATARNEAALAQLAKAAGCEWQVCDVKHAEQVEKLMSDVAKKHGAVDVLINNAGVIVNGELVDTSVEDIDNVIQTNTLGSIYAAKAALKYMKQQKSGLIVNVVSQSGIYARANRSIYNASKWALTGFTKSLQEEAAAYGVRVTGFYPGTIQTRLFAKAGIDMQGLALTLDDAVRSVEFLLSFDEAVLIPELGIKHI